MIDINDHPTMIGFSESGTKELHSINEVADFIYNEGLKGDTRIETADGDFVLDTYGMCLNNISDMNYRSALLEILTPMQMGVGSYSFLTTQTYTPQNFFHKSRERIIYRIFKETVDIINQMIYNIKCDNSFMDVYYDYF